MRLNLLKTASDTLKPIVETAMEGEPHPMYARDTNGNPVFQSTTITLDHLISNPDGHLRFKTIPSTEKAHEALINMMMEYYGEDRGGFINNPVTFEILSELKSDPDNSIVVYSVPAQITDRFGGLIFQVVVSSMGLQKLVLHPKFGNGSSLLAMDKLVGSVQASAKVAHARLGEVPPLMLLKIPAVEADKAAE